MYRGRKGRSWPRPDNAAWRNAGDLVSATILGRQLVAIGAGRAAYDAALMVTGEVGGLFPGPVVGHRAFDGKYAAVMVGDDEVERLVGHFSVVLNMPFMMFSATGFAEPKNR